MAGIQVFRSTFLKFQLTNFIHFRQFSISLQSKWRQRQPKCCKQPVSPPEKKTRKSSADRGRGDRISGPPDRPVMICPFTGNAASDNLSLSPIYLFNSRQRCTQRLQSSFSHYSSNTCYFCYI